MIKGVKLIGGTQTWYDLAMWVFGAAIMTQLKSSTFYANSLIGLALLAWYFIAVLQRISLIMGWQPHQMDLQLFYIIIDVMTVYYLVYIKINPLVINLTFKIMWIYLALWFGFFTIVDICVIPIKQPNNFGFNLVCLGLGLSTLYVIIRYELIKHKKLLRKIFKW